MRVRIGSRNSRRIGWLTATLLATIPGLPATSPAQGVPAVPPLDTNTATTAVQTAVDTAVQATPAPAPEPPAPAPKPQVAPAPGDRGAHTKHLARHLHGEHVFAYHRRMTDHDFAQRAVLAALLQAHPRMLGIDDLTAQLKDVPRAREALRVLVDDGLATQLGDRVGVSRAAMRFDALSPV